MVLRAVGKEGELHQKIELAPAQKNVIANMQESP